MSRDYRCYFYTEDTVVTKKNDIVTLLRKKENVKYFEKKWFTW